MRSLRGNGRTFNVGLSTAFAPRPDLPSLTFAVPPNDLRAHASTRAEFTFENEEEPQAMTINITPELRGGKSFLVFSEDPRLTVKSGLIAPDRSSFPIELALNAPLDKEKTLSLKISHMDIWQPFAQPTAQAQLNAGTDHTCGIKADGRAACWGDNFQNRAEPTASEQNVDADTRFLAVGAGNDNSCAIKADGTAACWGFHNFDPTESPQGVDANTRFFAVDVGDLHSCGIKADGRAACWGSSGSESNPTSSPQGVNANTRFLALSVGAEHNCAIKADSTMACWGNNSDGESDPTRSLQDVDANTRFLAVSAGGAHTCGIRADHTVACWGDNRNGESDPTRSLQDVNANTRFLAVSAGTFHNCGIKADGRAACWSSSGNESNPTSSPHGVDANTRFLAVSVGGSHTCAIKEDGAAACWGDNRDGKATPPPDDFSRTPDVFRLAEKTTPLTTRDGGESVRLNEVTEVRILQPRIMLREGESTTLALFRALSAPTDPVTIRIGESDERILRISPSQFTLSGTVEAMTTITAPDNMDYLKVDPIKLSVEGPVRLAPAKTVTVIIENDEVYDIGFDREMITLEEGMSANVRLSISPAPAGEVTVEWSFSDGGQLAMEPERVVFSAANAAATVVVTVTDDDDAEIGRTFTVRPVALAGIDATVDVLSVTAPADDDAPKVRITAGRAVIPEGSTALVFIDATLNRELSLSATASGLAGARTRVSFSPPSLTLSPSSPSASFLVSVADNDEPQGDGRTFDVGMITEFTPEPRLSPFAFTVPPNDLMAHASARAEFALDEPEQTMEVVMTPPLSGSKTFLVSPEDPRIAVKAGLITRARSPFPVELALSEDTVLGEEELLNLNITQLDIWRPFAQPSAQAQLSAGTNHACGIKEDGRMACWGSNTGNLADPASSPHGVDANTRFLAVSAGGGYTCAIKADNTMACWGSNDGNRANPASSPHGVDANTRFLAVSAGLSPHLRHQSG